MSDTKVLMTHDLHCTAVKYSNMSVYFCHVSCTAVLILILPSSNRTVRCYGEPSSIRPCCCFLLSESHCCSHQFTLQNPSINNAQQQSGNHASQQPREVTQRRLAARQIGAYFYVNHLYFTRPKRPTGGRAV